MIFILFMLMLVCIIFFGVTKPIEKPKYDETVKSVSKFKMVSIITYNVLLFIMIGYIIYLFSKTISSYSQFTKILSSNQSFVNAIEKITISSDMANNLIIPIVVSMLLAMIAFIFIGYIALLGIYRLITTIVGYKQQKNNREASKLLQAIKKDNSHDIVNAYFEMKESKNKYELFTSQWSEIINDLLLNGEVKEAENLNAYIHERVKYCVYRKRIFRSVYKVSLFDEKGLIEDKLQANRIKKKISKKHAIQK